MANLLRSDNTWRNRSNVVTSVKSRQGVTADSVAAGNWDADNNDTRVVGVVAGASYLVSGTAALSAAVSNRVAKLVIEWLTSTGSVISGPSVFQTLTPGAAPSTLTIGGGATVAPATAAGARFVLRGEAAAAGGERIVWAGLTVDGPTTAPTLVSFAETPGVTSATVETRTANTSTARLDVATTPDFTGTLIQTATQTPDGAGDSTHTISGLTAGTTYYWRVIAAGPTTLAGDTFVTGTTPTLVSTSTVNVAATTATVLADTANATSVRLDLDTQATFATATPTAAQTPDVNGETTHALTGLTAETIYYYRVVADGVALAGGTFTTTAAAIALAVEYYWWDGSLHPVAGAAQLPAVITPGGGADAPIRVDVGGPSGTYDGLAWSGDLYVDGTAFTVTDPGQLAQLNQVHITHRYGTNGSLRIRVPVTWDTVQIRLHFVDPTFAAGRRLFDVVSLAGVVIDDYDISAAVGRGALDIKTVVIAAVDGFADLHLVASLDNPIIAAFEVSNGVGKALTPIVPGTGPPAEPTIIIRTALLNYVPLDGRQLSQQDQPVFVAGPGIVGPVTWHLDEPVDASPHSTSTAEPWQFANGSWVFTAGSHTVRAVVPLTGGTSTTLVASFEAPATTIGGGGSVVTDATGTQAGPAERVARISGVNTHWEYGTYQNVPGGNRAIAERMVEVGFRHHRGDVNPSTGGIIQYCGENGILDWPMMGHADNTTPTKIVEYLNARRSTLHAQRAYIEGIQGANEVDNGTQQSTSNMRDSMQALWNSVKGDPILADLPVCSISMTWPFDANVQGLGDMSAYVDAIDFHPYPGAHRGEWRVPGDLTKMRALLTAKGTPFSAEDYDYIDRPGGFAITSETGYHNAIGKIYSHHGVPRDISAALSPAMALYYDSIGIARLQHYEMLNQPGKGNETGTAGNQGSYGLLDETLGRKPEFYAIKNLIDIYGDRGPAFKPGKLDYTVAGNAQTKDYLHQTRNGKFLIGLYQNVELYDGAQARYLNPPNVAATVKLNARNATVRTRTPYYPGGPTTITSSPSTPLAQGATTAVTLNGWLTVVEVTP